MVWQKHKIAFQNLAIGQGWMEVKLEADPKKGLKWIGNAEIKIKLYDQKLFYVTKNVFSCD